MMKYACRVLDLLFYYFKDSWSMCAAKELYNTVYLQCSGLCVSVYILKNNAEHECECLIVHNARAEQGDGAW